MKNNSCNWVSEIGTGPQYVQITCMTVSVYQQCYEIFNLCVELFVITSTNGGLWVLAMRKHIPLEFLPGKTHSCLHKSFSCLPSFILFFCCGWVVLQLKLNIVIFWKREVCVRGSGKGVCSEKDVIHTFAGLTQGLSADQLF